AYRVHIVYITNRIMKTSTIHPPLPTIRSPLAADTSYYNGFWIQQIRCISNNYNKLPSRKINTVKLQKSLPLLTRLTNSFCYNHSVPILCFSKYILLLKDIRNPYFWFISVLHKNTGNFYSSQTAYKLKKSIGSFLRDIISHYYKTPQVSTGYLLFQKAPKNPT